MKSQTVLNGIQVKILLAILAVLLALAGAAIYQRHEAAKAAEMQEQQQYQQFRQQVEKDRKLHDSAAGNEGKTWQKYTP